MVEIPSSGELEYCIKDWNTAVMKHNYALANESYYECHDMRRRFFDDCGFSKSHLSLLVQRNSLFWTEGTPDGWFEVTVIVPKEDWKMSENDDTDDGNAKLSALREIHKDDIEFAMKF